MATATPRHRSHASFRLRCNRCGGNVWAEPDGAKIELGCLGCGQRLTVPPNHPLNTALRRNDAALAQQVLRPHRAKAA